MYRRWDKSKPPSGSFALNRDCPQAQGIIAWYPMGGITGNRYIPDYFGKTHLAYTADLPPKISRNRLGAPVISYSATNDPPHIFTGGLPIPSTSIEPPLLLTAWFTPDIAALNSMVDIININSNSTSSNYFRLGFRGDVAGDPVRAAYHDGTTLGDASSSAGASAVAGTYHAAALFSTNSSRTAYFNGGSAGSNSTVCSTHGTLTDTNIGGLVDAYPFSGDIGECGIWKLARAEDGLPTIQRLYDPSTRFELWYPLRSRKWFTQAPVTPPAPRNYVTSRQRLWDKSKPPTGQFTLNRDCPQAQGLAFWYPGSVMDSPQRIWDGRGGLHIPANPSGTPPSIQRGASGEVVRKFVRANSNRYVVSTAWGTAAPLTMACWFNPDEVTNESFLVSVSFYGMLYGDFLGLALLGTTAGDPIAAMAYRSGQNSESSQVTGTQAGVWQHAAAVFASTTSRTAYLNGAAGAESTVSVAPINIDSSAIGGLYRQDNPNVYANGQIGEVCVWNVSVPASVVQRCADPGKRFELFYPLRSRKWFSMLAPTTPVLSAATVINVQSTQATPRVTVTF